jgi:hypothetical protein
MKADDDGEERRTYFTQIYTSGRENKNWSEADG